MGRNSNDEPVTLGRGIAEGQTDLALRVRIVEPEAASLHAGDELWIPKSVIHDDSECFGMGSEEKSGHVVVKQWWAEKGGHV